MTSNLYWFSCIVFVLYEYMYSYHLYKIIYKMWKVLFYCQTSYAICILFIIQPEHFYFLCDLKGDCYDYYLNRYRLHRVK